MGHLECPKKTTISNSNSTKKEKSVEVEARRESRGIPKKIIATTTKVQIKEDSEKCNAQLVSEYYNTYLHLPPIIKIILNECKHTKRVTN